MVDQIKDLADKKGVECEILTEGSASLLSFKGDLEDIVEVVKESGVDLDKVGYGFKSEFSWGLDVDEDAVLVSIRERRSRDLSRDELDALMDTPWVEYEDEYSLYEGGVLLDVYSEGGKRLGGFELVDFKEVDGELKSYFRFSGPEYYTIAEYRANGFLETNVSIDCPDCGSDLTYDSNKSPTGGFKCYSCVEYFYQPYLFDGVELSDSQEDIGRKIQENFVETIELEEVESFGDGFLFEDVGSYPVVAEASNIEFPDSELETRVGFAENYPPVSLEDGSVKVMEMDEEGECWFTGDMTEKKVSILVNQQFECGAVYGKFMQRSVSSEIIQDIEDDLDL